MSEHRIEKIESLMRQVLAEMLQREFIPPEGAIVSLTQVSASGNLQEAKVYISIIPDSATEPVFRRLARGVRFFQNAVNKKLKMRPVPKIIFVLDQQGRQAQNVETILEQLKKN
jgi:ribosome-binding factor A